MFALNFSGGESTRPSSQASSSPENNTLDALATTETIIPTLDSQISPSASASPMATTIETIETNNQNTTQWCRYIFTKDDAEAYPFALSALLYEKFGTPSSKNYEFENNVAEHIRCAPVPNNHICTYDEFYRQGKGYYQVVPHSTMDIPIALITKDCKENGGKPIPPQQ